MAASSIKNPSVEVCAMPYPFQGILQGGQTIILPYTPAELASVCPSLASALVVTDLGDYAGDTDEATYGPTSDGEGSFATLSVSDTAQSSGERTLVEVTGADDTGVTASTEQTDVYFNLGHTVTWATGALADQRFFRIDAPTIAFAGASTVTNASTVYVSGAPLAGANATITNSYALFVDNGACRFDGTSLFGGAATFAPTAGAATIRTALTVTGAADTARTASTEQPDVYVNLGRTVQWATGALTNQRFVQFLAPTISAVGASTVTNTATLYVDNAPQAGANATLTNSYALWVDAGMTRLDGGLTLAGNTGFYGAAAAAQPAAVADAAGGATVDAEARTALNTLLARLRVIGLIAT